MLCVTGSERAGRSRSLEVEVTLGVGVPGLVNRQGVLQAAPNLDGVAHFDVAGRLRAAFAGAEMRIEVDNDATCAAAAEWKLGAGAGVSDLVLVTLGTGIGGFTGGVVFLTNGLSIT